ncbi:unnamed protein product [Orchesella dallaii]|uniref:Meiotic nuclear division protein 1 homolog n=1 Tax=Orchesella dallaii TaxID=48710 RepID=A0ABP1RB01_9HEXA
MSKRKGVSLEDKRKRMLELFYEKKDVFQLKELEKLGPAEKGVIAQSVKDVVQALVDDGYVDSEKIGTSVYFWAFPSKATQTWKRKISDLESKLEELTKQKDTITNDAKRAKLDREDTEERDELIKKALELKVERDKLVKLVEQYKDSDPDVIKQEQKDIETAKCAGNRWTDNVFSVCSWLKQKFNMDQEALSKQFGIPEDFDYLP